MVDVAQLSCRSCSRKSPCGFPRDSHISVVMDLSPGLGLPEPFVSNRCLFSFLETSWKSGYAGSIRFLVRSSWLVV